MGIAIMTGENLFFNLEPRDMELILKKRLDSNNLDIPHPPHPPKSGNPIPMSYVQPDSSFSLSYI